LEQAAEALPLSGGPGGGLSAAERRAALRLLQAIRLFDLDPYQGEPPALLAQLPDWAFQGASGRRSKKKGEEVREGLAELLAAARAAEVKGVVQEGVVVLVAVGKVGLAEALAPVLAERGAIARLAQVESEKGAWSGLGDLTAELAAQTGVTIDRPA